MYVVSYGVPGSTFLSVQVLRRRQMNCLELELELIQTRMAQKPLLRVGRGVRKRRAKIKMVCVGW